MRILIENAEEVAYLTGSGHWTKEPGEGSSFASTRAAFAAARREPIGNFNIVQFFALNGQIVNLDHGRGTLKEARPVQLKSQSPDGMTEFGPPEPAVAMPPVLTLK